MGTTTVISALNVNYALPYALVMLAECGQETNSRNGPVIRAPGLVVTEYERPWERLVFNPVRDANHVFHLMETIWMLAGQNDVNWLLKYNSSFGQFAEANGVQHGAYGRRWRGFFNGVDQLRALEKELRVPGNRRAVLGMWSPAHDLGSGMKDVPCNTHVYFDVDTDSRLNMTVCCRSNDVMWGAYGANAVHFSMLQELLALHLGVSIGTYYQVSNNFHMYTEFGPGVNADEMQEIVDPYRLNQCPSLVMIGHGETMWDFLEDCEKFVHGNAGAMRTYFMRHIAFPLSSAYLGRKAGRDDYHEILASMPNCDWKLAFKQWAERRNQKEK